MLHTKAGTPLHQLADALARAENLSFILAWTSMNPWEAPESFLRVERVEMPRLQLTWDVRRGPKKEQRLYSVDHSQQGTEPFLASKSRCQGSFCPLSRPSVLGRRRCNSYRPWCHESHRCGIGDAARAAAPERRRGRRGVEKRLFGTPRSCLPASEAEIFHQTRAK